MLLVAAIACTGPAIDNERGAHLEALETLAIDPMAAHGLCSALRDADLKADCAWAFAQTAGREHPAEAAQLCTPLSGLAGDECWFLLAESTDDAGHCEHAGRLEDDCRMHHLSRALLKLPRDLALNDSPALVEPLITAAGLSVEDDRPWSAWFRQSLSRQKPLDRSRCEALDSGPRTICERTAGAVFHDLLNFHRDTGSSLCEGPLPERLKVRMDPEFEAQLAERRAQDLCDPDAVQARPDGLPGGAP